MFSANAIKVLQKRYLLRKEQDSTLETPEDLFQRVAACVAGVEQRWGVATDEIESLRGRFFQMMYSRQFMPNSPTLMNAGKANGQLSACFVLPVPDNLEGIFETCKNAALIHKTGGGTGFSFNRLRPANDRVATTSGVASGPVSFMTVYDAATEAIRQGGARRGANMGILNIDHPDIETFIQCKRDTGKLNNFNISVAVSDAFMRAVKDDEGFALVHPTTGKVVREVRARRLFDQIVDNAHATGEPGIIFLDRINAADPLHQAVGSDGNIIPGTEDIESTNPCGEQPLGPGDACNLGSINLSLFIRDDGSDFDFDALGEVVTLAVRFLDNIVEANHYPLPFIDRAARNNRRIGLGVMGWAEALIKLQVPYDTPAAITKAEEVMSFIAKRAHAASSQLAERRGSFPNWQYSTWAEKHVPMRNATVTAIAPTGTISMIAGTSAGIEPIFAVSYLRRVMEGTELIEVNPLFEEMAIKRGFYSQELMRRIAEQGTIRHVENVPEDVKRLWVCSHDIDYTWHVKMQAAFQKHTDCAVSKTINFPSTATVEEVRAAYLLAYELGLKGITVYRDTSRRFQVLNLRATDPLKKDQFAGRLGTVSSPRFSGSAGGTTYGYARGGEEKNANGPWENERRLAGGHMPFAVALGEEKGRSSCPDCSSAWDRVSRLEACLFCSTCGYTRC